MSAKASPACYSRNHADVLGALSSVVCCKVGKGVRSRNHADVLGALSSAVCCIESAKAYIACCSRNHAGIPIETLRRRFLHRVSKGFHCCSRNHADIPCGLLRVPPSPIRCCHRGVSHSLQESSSSRRRSRRCCHRISSHPSRCVRVPTAAAEGHQALPLD